MALEEELTLNIDAALSEVDRLGATLTQVTQQFSADLASALDPLQSVDVAVAVETDTSGVAGDIDSAVAEASAVVAVEADTTEAADDVASLSGDPVVVPVVADTGEARSQIDGLGESASGASGSLAGLDSASVGLAASAGLAGGSADELAGALGGLGAGAAVGVGAFTALAAVGAQFFDVASGNVSAAQRLDSTFGEFQGTLNDVQIGSLNTDLETLSQSLGTNASDLQDVAASLGTFATASGASQEEAAGFAQQVSVLGARAVALNPNLGDVASTTQNLQTALARGGRFATNYGLSLNAAEIEARALADTGKATARELTQYEKAAAGAAIATEKYGADLDAVIAQGTANPVIGLKAITNQFVEFTEVVGTPLVAPILDLLTSLNPLLMGVAGAVGSLITALLPLGQGVVDALSPLATGVFDVLGQTFAALSPAIREVATAFTSLIGPIATGLRPALDGLIAGVVPLGDALANLVRSNQPLIQLLGNTLGVLAEGAALSVGAILQVIGELVKALDSLGVFTNPLVELAEGLGLIESNATGAAGASSRLGYNARAAATDVEGLREAMARTDAEFADFIVTESEFARSSGVVDALRRTRIPFSQLQDDLSDLDVGLKNFVASAIDAGQVTIRTPEGISLTAADVRSLNGELTTYLNASGAVVVQGEGLVQSFINQSLATEQQSRATFDAVAAQRSLTNEQITALGAQAAAQFGVDSYANRLRVLAQTETEAATATAGTTTAQFGQAAAYVALTQAVAAGTVTTANAAQAAQALGLDVQVATTAIGNAEAAINTFVSNALSKFPTVATAFEEVKRSANPNDPASLANSLNAATLAALTFQSNLSTLRGEFPETVAFLQEQGPQAAGAFAAAFASATPEVQAQLEAAIKANKGALGSVEADLRGSIATNRDAAAALGSEVTGALGEKLEFDKVTTEELGAATTALRDATPGQAQEAGQAGAAIGDALGAGIALGLGRQSPMIEAAARAAIERADEAARAAAESQSPSRLFARLGDDLIAGLDLGINRSADDSLSTWTSLLDSFAAVSQERAKAAVAFWGDEVGNQIARSWTSGRLGTLVDQFQNARLRTPDTFVGNQRLGQLPGNATVVVNVEAPAGTDPMAAREFGQTVGIEVRKGLASMRAGVLAG